MRNAQSATAEKTMWAVPEAKPVQKSQSRDQEKPRELVQHFYGSNGGSIPYLKNGAVKNQPRSDTAGDFIAELMRFPTVGTFKDFSTYIIEYPSTAKTDFFDEQGRIDLNWHIINGIDINNTLQISSFTTPKNSNPKNTNRISETSLIIFNPDLKTFENENSEEAEV